MNVAGRFGDNVKRQRKLADLSQEELSIRASLHRTEVSQIERGLRLCRVDTLAKLAGALEINPEKFFQGIIWRPGEFRPGSFTEEDP